MRCKSRGPFVHDTLGVWGGGTQNEDDNNDKLREDESEKGGRAQNPKTGKTSHIIGPTGPTHSLIIP